MSMRLYTTVSLIRYIICYFFEDDFLDLSPCSLAEIDQRFRGAEITLMMEAVITSETLVNFYETTRCKTQKTVIFILAAFRT
jgi:hypothetical protein